MLVNRFRREQADAGFTLIELVVAIAILGFIAAALTGVVIEYLKVTTSAETRLSESTDVQFVSTYWQNDVSSMGLRAALDPKALDPVPASGPAMWVGTPGGGETDPGGCGGTAQLVASFAWDSYSVGAAPASAWDKTTTRVAYVAIPSGSDYVIKRVWCGPTSEPTLIVAHHVTTWTVTCDGVTCPGATPTTIPATVKLMMHIADLSEASTTGFDTYLTAERRQG